MLGNEQAFWDQGNILFDQIMQLKKELRGTPEIFLEVWLLEDGAGRALHQNNHLVVLSSKENALAYMDDRYPEFVPKRWGLKKLE